MPINKSVRRCLTNIIQDCIKPILHNRKTIQKAIINNKIQVKQSQTKLSRFNFELSSLFVNTEIQTLIYNDIDFVETIEVQINHTIFIVKLFTSTKWAELYKHKQHEMRVKKMIDALAITLGMSQWSSCNLRNKQIIINLFDIEKPKQFIPYNRIIEPINVNSAYTVPCKYGGYELEVVIFRNEEWDKVLFHELIHLYSYDIGSNDKRMNNRLSRIFNINCDFKLTEAYSEFWARILWSLWRSNGDLNKFVIEIDKQQNWSIHQGVIVLTNTGIIDNVLDKDLRNKRIVANVYKENTAAFSYYVISGFMMSDWKNVIYWCYKTNKIPFKFNSTLKNINSFISLIREIVKDDAILDLWCDEEEKLPDVFYNMYLTAKMTL